RDRLLPDHRAQEEPLDEEAEQEGSRQAGGHGEDKRQVGDLRDGQRAERPEGDKVALGQVDHAARLVNQHEPQGRERVDHAHHDPVREELQKDRERGRHPPATSATRTAVSTTAVVPSRYVIVARTGIRSTDVPYTASMRSAYRSPMTRRLTLRVRVSSPSSASSSLWRRTNRRTRAERGRVSFAPRTSAAIRSYTPAFCERSVY